MYTKNSVGLERTSFRIGDSMEFKTAKEVVRGKDGTVIYTVDSKEWDAFVADIIKTKGSVEWYMQKPFRWMKEHLNVGYKANGIGIQETKTIHVRKGREKDESLLVHEYGHVLGYGHTHPLNPNIMNPVDNMRVTDGDKITERFKENFPEYYEKVLVPSETQQAVSVAIALGIILFGVMS